MTPAAVNLKVVDLSHYDTVTSLEAMAGAGIEGVIHKATEGTGVVDTLYHERADWMGEKVLWGAYHFWRPMNTVKQAQHFLDFLSESPMPGLLAIDYEVKGGTLAQVQDFIEQVEAATGLEMVVYGNAPYLGEQLAHADQAQLKFFRRRRLWWAEYANAPARTPWTPWLWQYTEKGPLPGLKRPGDLNSFLGKDLREEWTLNSSP